MVQGREGAQQRPSSSTELQGQQELGQQGWGDGNEEMGELGMRE